MKGNKRKRHRYIHPLRTFEMALLSHGSAVYRYRKGVSYYIEMDDTGETYLFPSLTKKISLRSIIEEHNTEVCTCLSGDADIVARFSDSKF